MLHWGDAPVGVGSRPEVTEAGGVEARRGFRFQDHVSVRVVLQALADLCVDEVWLEVRDDVTVLRNTTDGATREYVQAKASTGDSLWSISQLCRRQNAGPVKSSGLSLLEMSLAKDDLPDDPSPQFRIVTQRDVNSDLALLKMPTSHRDRTGEPIRLLAESLMNLLPEAVSPAGRDVRYWCENTVWEVFESERSLQDSNLIALMRLQDRRGYILNSDQLRVAHASLLQSLAEIATQRPPSERTLAMAALIELAEMAITQAMPHIGLVANNKLRVKMQAADVPEPLILAAEDRRLSYVEHVYRSGYAELRGDGAAMDEIRARLSILLASYLEDSLPAPGRAFHLACMDSVERVCADLPPAGRPPLNLALGCMYETANRCAHRFTVGEPT